MFKYGNCNKSNTGADQKQVKTNAFDHTSRTRQTKQVLSDKIVMKNN